MDALLTAFGVVGGGAVTFFHSTAGPYGLMGVGLFAGIIWASWPSIEPRLRWSKRPLLMGDVARFAILDARDLKDAEFADLEREFRGQPTVSQYLTAAFRRPPGFWYIAWLRIQTTGRPSRATHWSFVITGRDGSEFQCTPISKDWGAPASWPKLQYVTLDAVQNMFLQNHALYNVFFHVLCEAPESALDMNSFRVKLWDDNGVEVVCKMIGAESSP